MGIAAALAIHAAGAGVVLWVGARPADSGLVRDAVELAVVYAEASRGGEAPWAAEPNAEKAQAQKPVRRAQVRAEPQSSPGPAQEERAVAPPAMVEVDVAEGSPGDLAVAAPPAPGGAVGSGEGGAAGGGDGSGGVAAGPVGHGSGGAAGTGAVDTHGEIAARLARAAKDCYPRAALRFRSEGTARVRFCIDEKGAPFDAVVLQSSGMLLLDEAATGCVLKRAAPLPPARDCLVVPVRFSVRR